MEQSGLEHLREIFREGGFFMYVLLVVLSVATARMLERASRLYWSLPARMGALLRRVHDAAHVGAAGQEEARGLRPGVGALVEELVRTRRLLFHRLDTLKDLSWLALVLGAIGTAVGWTRGYTVFALATPEQKTALFLNGIRESMHVFVFGALVALLCSLGHALLAARARDLGSSIDCALARLGSVSKSRQIRGRRSMALASPCFGQPASSMAGSLPGLNALPFILTGLLMFILRVHNTSPTMSLAPNLYPPVSTARLELFREATTVAITRNDLHVDDKRVAELGSTPLTPDQLGELEKALLARKERLKKIEDMGGPPFDANLLVAADRSVDYGVLYQVLEVAGRAGFPYPKLIVLSP